MIDNQTWKLNRLGKVWTLKTFFVRILKVWKSDWHKKTVYNDRFYMYLVKNFNFWAHPPEDGGQLGYYLHNLIRIAVITGSKGSFETFDKKNLTLAILSIKFTSVFDSVESFFGRKSPRLRISHQLVIRLEK